MWLSVPLSFALPGVAFHLLTEWRDISERWDRERGGAAELEWSSFSSRGLQTAAHHSARWSTSGGGARPAGPSAHRVQEHTQDTLSHARLPDTLTGRSSWTAVTQTQERLQRSRWQRRGHPMSNFSPVYSSCHIGTLPRRIYWIYESSFAGFHILFDRINTSELVGDTFSGMLHIR